MLLTGEAGLGKTLILQRCMAEADDIRFIFLGDAHLDFPDILDYLCADLGLSGDEPDVVPHNRLLLDALAAYASRDQAVALLIDDAHLLPVSTLLGLWEFVATSVVAADQRLQVVLAGLPAIEDKLGQPELRPLQEHIRVRCRLSPLSRLETGLFVHQQFKAAGHVGGDLLSAAAVERIAYHSQGVPRAIAKLCDAVLLFARLQSERTITPAMVDEVAGICFLDRRAELPGPTDVEPPSAPTPIAPPSTAEVARRRWSPGTWFNSLALAAVMATSVIWLWPAERVVEEQPPTHPSSGQREQAADPPDASPPVSAGAPVPAAIPPAVPVPDAAESGAPAPGSPSSVQPIATTDGDATDAGAPAPESRSLLPTGTAVAPLALDPAPTTNPQVRAETRPKVTESRANPTPSQPPGASPPRSRTTGQQASRIQSQPRVAQSRKGAKSHKGTNARRGRTSTVPYPWERPTTSGFNQK